MIMIVIIPKILSLWNIDLSLISCQWKYTGIKKPITGLIVDPTSVIASPTPSMNRAGAMLTDNKRRVTMKFCLLFMPFSLKNNSSIESLEGKTQRGAAVITENKRLKLPISINLLP